MSIRRKFSITTALFAILMVCSMGGWAQLGKIHGTVKQGGVAIPQAKVMLYQGNQFTGKGMLTDDQGKYEFALLDAGEYRIVVNVAGTDFSQAVSVSPGESQPFDMALIAMAPEENDSVKKDFRLPSVDITERLVLDVDREMPILTRKEIGQMAGPRDVNTMVAFSGAPIVQKDAGDPLSFKGARETANATYFDGMKIRGTDQIPLGAIEQIAVMSGGVPAEFGDALGAVIVVTTRNPAMTMGHVGKPLTKAEKQMLKQQRKKGTSQSLLDGEMDLACR